MQANKHIDRCANRIEKIKGVKVPHKPRRLGIGGWKTLRDLGKCDLGERE